GRDHLCRAVTRVRSDTVPAAFLQRRLIRNSLYTCLNFLYTTPDLVWLIVDACLLQCRTRGDESSSNVVRPIATSDAFALSYDQKTCHGGEGTWVSCHDAIHRSPEKAARLCIGNAVSRHCAIVSNPSCADARWSLPTAPGARLDRKRIYEC